MKKKNRILVISNLYPSVKDNTYGTFVHNFVQSLCEKMPDCKIDICVIKGRPISKIEKLIKYLALYISIFYQVLVFRYDLIYVHYITFSSIPLRFLSKIKKLNIAFNIHGDDLLTKTKIAESVLIYILPILKKSKLIVLPSDFFMHLLLNRFPSIKKEQIYISASSGIGDSFFVCHNKQGLNLELGYVSRIDEGKGWNIFCDAVGKLVNMGVNVHAVMAGGGGQVELLKSKIESMNLTNNISYLGAVEQEKLSNLYSSIDLFVFPTLLWESLGLVGLEAMASFTPVIGSDLGGLKSFIQDNYNGYLYKAGDSDELCIKILKYLSLTDIEKKIMGDNARQTAMLYKSDLVSTALVKKIKYIYNL